MSEEGFHVHGPHDHALEHAAQGEHGDTVHKGIGGGSLTNQIALFTAIIATVGALFSYMGGATQAEAILHKNTASIKKTEASDQWNLFQSKSTKQSLTEFARDLSPATEREKYQAMIDRYGKEKTEIKGAAEKLDAEAITWLVASDQQMHIHHRWAQATTLLQIAIALAAMALLTKNKWLEKGMYAMGGGGVLLGVLAWLHI
jgi:hypothetical protein